MELEIQQAAFPSDKLQFKVPVSHNIGLENLKRQPSECFLAELHKEGKPQAPFLNPASHLAWSAAGQDHKHILWGSSGC